MELTFFSLHKQFILKNALQHCMDMSCVFLYCVGKNEDIV